MSQRGEEHKYISNIMNASLSPITKRVYLQRLKVMMEELQMNIHMLVTNPKDAIEWIFDTYTSDQTRKSYLSAVLGVFRHNPDLKEKEKDSYLKWYDAFSKTHGVIEDRYKHNEPSERQKAAYVPFDTIIQKREALKKGTAERLLLAFYTHLPPLRCDFNKVYIYNTLTNDPTEKNYIHLQGTECGKLVLNEYKTQKGKQAYEKELPPELCEELRQSLKEYPRDWLFVDKNGKPFSAKSYTQWANRILAKVLGKRMTVSMMRHSFINSLDFNTLTVAEKEEIAKDMAHTIGTQDRYRLIFTR